MARKKADAVADQLNGDDTLAEASAIVGAARAAARKPGSWADAPDRAERDAEHLKALETLPPAKSKAIILPKMDIRIISIRLVGDESLICHHWSEKAIKIILDKQMGIASPGREHKSPEQDFADSLYVLGDGVYGFPTIAFKKAAVTACTSLGRSVITKVAARQAFHVIGEYARIEGSEPRMRSDMVQLDQGGADIRFRGEFMPWSVQIKIRYNHRVLSEEQLVNLFNVAGFAVGVGEWRSEKDGSHGLFHVENESDRS